MMLKNARLDYDAYKNWYEKSEHVKGVWQAPHQKSVIVDDATIREHAGEKIIRCKWDGGVEANVPLKFLTLESR